MPNSPEPIPERERKIVNALRLTGAIMAVSGALPFCILGWELIHEVWWHEPVRPFACLMITCAWIGSWFGGLLGKQMARGRGVLKGTGLGLCCGLIVGLLTGFIIYPFVGALIGAIIGAVLGAVLGTFTSIPFVLKKGRGQEKK